METRKRPLTDEQDSSIAKKRILTGANGSPHVNGSSEDHDDEDEGYSQKLEFYRKDALYRRMRHYAREHERSKTRIEELEQRKTTCEAGLAAMAACWAQLVDTIRLIVKPDDLPQVHIRSKEIFDLTAHVNSESSPEFAAALSDTFNATQALVTKFVQLGEEKHSDLLQNERFEAYQKAQNECIVLRSELNVLQTRLQESQADKENYHDALVAAENRYYRSKSEIVREMETRGQAPEKVKDERAEERRSSPAALPISSAQANGMQDALEVETLRAQLKARESKIIELEREAAVLRDQKTMLDLQCKAPTLEQISESPFYKVLLGHASHLEATVSDKSNEVRRLEEELKQLQDLRAEWVESSLLASNQETQDLKSMLNKRDAENVRLREQRDQFAAENSERRQKDSIKLASLQEYKSLVDSNAERLNILKSELVRCKAQLAANANSEELMLFFLDGDIDQVRYFERMKEQKSELERRLQALETAFSDFDKDHPDVAKHMQAEAEALEQLSKARKELDKYQRIFGSSSSLSPDASHLAEQLRAKESELEKLRLLERQRQENESSLYVELEKLSALWESLDKQLKSKVLDLSAMEERLSKSAIDKAKSDNKYFAAMRDKEAIENERKNLARTLEKQGKAVDRLTDIEKHLKTQMTALEKEAQIQRKCCETLRDRVTRFEKDNPELVALYEVERKRVQELSNSLAEREAFLQAKRAEHRTKEDEFILAKKEMEKRISELKREVKLGSSGRDGSEDPDLVAEMNNLRALAMCSTCHETFRGSIIVKCGHTFCKKCVDDRLATRQRKCPACSLPFGHSDVQPFFFQ
ncbi:BRE1-domain-containing protein [Agrocybe pediades]|nr:BRE1-domain-containing protein [Agrocybe pediades]